MALNVNEENIKHTVVSRRSPNMDYIRVGNYTFEKVYDFKYLGVNSNSKNDIYVKINEWIMSGNRCYPKI